MKTIIKEFVGITVFILGVVFMIGGLLILAGCQSYVHSVYFNEIRESSAIIMIVGFMIINRVSK